MQITRKFCAQAEDGDSEDEEDGEILAPQLESLKQAINKLEDVWLYLDYNGYFVWLSQCVSRVLAKVEYSDNNFCTSNT